MSRNECVCLLMYFALDIIMTDVMLQQYQLSYHNETTIIRTTDESCLAAELQYGINIVKSRNYRVRT